VVGGSDSHNTGAPYRQNNFYGGHGINDGTIETRMSGHLFSGVDVRYENPAGLSAVWAEENTRASLWDAMYRKETFATSGTRIRVRFFGGWSYDDDSVKGKDWVKAAYAGGVPMGADLPPPKGAAPTFAVWAVKDPTAANLDRIQIVKGWSQNGQSFEKIYDVAWAGDREPDIWTGRIPPIESTVDIDEATYSNSEGARELATVWTDPEFDPTLHAFYYARVLEIPTPRWSTIQAKQIGVAPPDVVPATVQERAWSSPIWYAPNAEARTQATPGVTVASLTAGGARPLTEAELTKLVVGKSVWVQNDVTGEKLKIRYDENGDAVVLHVGREATLPSLTGDLARRTYDTTASSYAIRGGKIVTELSGTPISMAVYRSGDTYYGARSNEFGFANYEILPKGPANLLELGKGEYRKKDQSSYLRVTE
jgi:hypothetical protein